MAKDLSGFIAIQLGKDGSGEPCLGAFVDTKDTYAGSSSGGLQVGLFGMDGGGFMFCGTAKKEKHIILEHKYLDKNGNLQTGKIASGHIDADCALFKKSTIQDTFDFDGPIEFKEYFYPYPKSFPGTAPTWISWDPRADVLWRPGGSGGKGQWRFYTEIPSQGSEDPKPPKKPPSPPFDPTRKPPDPPPKKPKEEEPPPKSVVTEPGVREVPLEPFEPKEGGGGGGGGGNKPQSVTSFPGGKSGGTQKGCDGPTDPDPDPDPKDPVPPGEGSKKHTLQKSYLMGTGGSAASGGPGSNPANDKNGYLMNQAANSFNTLYAKPNQAASMHQYDVRSYLNPPPKKINTLYRLFSPVTMAIHAVGGWKKANHPVLNRNAKKLHRGKFTSKTGPGGFWLTQPEIDIQDFIKQNRKSGEMPDIANGTLSDSTLGLNTGVSLAFGYPDMRTGKLERGVRMYRRHSDGKIIGSVKNNAATSESDFMRLPGSDSDNVEILKTLDVTGDVTATQNLKIKSGTGFTATIEHTHTGNYSHVLQDEDGTLAHLTDIPTVPDELWEFDDSLSVDRLRTIDSSYGIAVNTDDDEPPKLHRRENPSTGINFTGTEDFQYWRDGNLILQSDSNADWTGGRDFIASRYLNLKGGTANNVQLQASPSANRTVTIPNSSGTVKYNTVRRSWSDCWGGVYGKHPTQRVAGGGKTGYAGGHVPDDTASISNVYAVIISETTDASVSLTFNFEYGASSQQHNAHTGTVAATNYNLTAGRLQFINVTSALGSLAAGDVIGAEVVNSDATTVVNFRGLLILETPTF